MQTQSPEGVGLNAGESGGGGTRQGRGDESEEKAGTRHQRARGSTRHGQPWTSRRREEHQEVPTTDQRTTTTGYCDNNDDDRDVFEDGLVVNNFEIRQQGMVIET